MRRPASGRRVGAGMLRVDAVRAIAKLRDYQLAEPTAWVLEAIRAAIASGATSIDLQGDSNDVWLSWTGTPWESESLPALLDELVSPASAREGQKLRLLGTAVNSALGLQPSYIDVFRIADGKAERVRYMASLLEDQGEDATELARPILEAIDLPTRAAGAAMFIHFRRRFGLEPLRNLLQGQPPEMRLARASCGDLPIPIRIGSDEYGAHRNQSDLIRIPIGNDIDGFLALLDPAFAPATGQAIMHVAEQGVVIASYAVDLDESKLVGVPPIRLFINAERMPTNASRSEVRRNAHPISSAERQMPELVAALCQEMMRQQAPEAETSSARRAQLRHATLALLASFISGHDWAHRARFLRKPFQELTTLSLVRNALGEARSLRESWDHTLIYDEKEALGAEMRPWFDQVLWRRDGTLEALFAPSIEASSQLRRRLRSARSELKAKKRFEAHTAREAIFERTPKVWVRASLRASLDKSAAPTRLHAYEGEIYLWPKGRNATITLLLDGREIEEVELDLAPLPFRAIVAAPLLTPTLTYRSVERNSYYKLVETNVLRAAVRCVETLCLGGSEGFRYVTAPSSDELRALVLGAIEIVFKLGLTLSSQSPLASYAAWQLADESYASICDLRQQDAIGLVSLSVLAKNAPTSRPTVIVERKQCDLLRRFLEPGTAVVDYQRCPKRSLYSVKAIAIANALCLEGVGIAAIAVEDGPFRGAMAWGMRKSELRIAHQSLQLTTYEPPPLLAGTTIAIESDHFIPNPTWDGLVDESLLAEQRYVQWQDTLVRAFALALIGRPPANFVTSDSPSLHTAAGETFVSVLLKATNVEELLGETYEALLAAPLFLTLGDQLVSIEDLARAFPKTIEYLSARPTVAVNIDDWQPLIANAQIASLAARLAKREVREAAKKLKRKLDDQSRLLKLQMHRQKTPVSQDSLLKQSPSCIAFQGGTARGLMGIGTTTTAKPMLDLYLLLEERHLQHSRTPCKLPLIAALEIDLEQLDQELEVPGPFLIEEIAAELVAAAPKLIEARLALDSTALASDRALVRFCGEWLEVSSLNTEEVQKVYQLASFYDQRGKPMALADAVKDAFLRVSTYETQSWIEAQEGAAANELDESILSVSEDRIEALVPILSELCRDVVVHDLSDSIRTLQIARRIEQGLLLAPTVPVDASLKRSLTDLVGGEVIGEIGFRDGKHSQVRVFDQGEEKARWATRQQPTVVIAIEDLSLLEKERDAMQPKEAMVVKLDFERRIASLTQKLLQSVLQAKQELPEWLRLQLVYGLCDGGISPTDFPGVTPLDLFQTTKGDWVSWDDLVTQAKLFGTVWHAPADDTRVPLDPDRIAVTLPDDLRKVLKSTLTFIAAEEDLALDEISRINQARPPLQSLVLSSEQSASAITTMTISDASGLKGIVAPLLPRAHALRGVHAHQDLKFVGMANDPCTWPTLALVTDEAVHPNRTWRAPVQDDRWQSIADEIVKVSDHALVKAMPPPADMLTSHWVGRSVESRDPVYRMHGICVRGRLWLTESSAAGSILLRYEGGEVVHHPYAMHARGIRFPLPIHGELMCHPASNRRHDEMIQEIVGIVYPRLLRQVANLKNVDPDPQAAHVALGLATAFTTPEVAGKIHFSCFAPKALAAHALLPLVKSAAQLVVCDGDAHSPRSEGLVFLRDQSELSTAIERLFAGRLVDMVPAKFFGHNVPMAPVISKPAPNPRPTPKVSAPIHVLDSLAEDLDRGLGKLDLHTVFAKVMIAADRSAPMLSYEAGNLVLAGNSPALRKWQALRLEGSSEHKSGIELLVAHALTLLNHGKTSVTDSAEGHALVTLMRTPEAS